MQITSKTTISRLQLCLLMHVCIILISIGAYRFVMTSNTTTVSTLQHNSTQASLGREFFFQLIHHNNSFNDVNEHTICSLMHFLFQEATHNGKSVRFSSGMFVLYDPTGRFFAQLMMAKNSQPHSDEHRSGYIRRIVYFTVDCIRSLGQMLSRRRIVSPAPFIYLRGDESSHFHERGNRYERWHLYPAYGMDITPGCMPNNFGHILFGKLRSLSSNTSRRYHGDRIYIKPERCGLQQFRHYLAHAKHYVQAVLHSFLCRYIDRFSPKFCTPKDAFHEWVDRRLVRRWTQLLTEINTLTQNERRTLQQLAFSQGILEIYRQTLLFPSLSSVNDFRLELERCHGSDVSARKGHEVIFTTEQLLNSSPSCATSDSYDKQQCVASDDTH